MDHWPKMKLKTIKRVQENKRYIFCGPELGQDFLNKTLKLQSIKQKKLITWTSSKSALQKILLRKRKYKPCTERKYLQNCFIKDWKAEYLKN